MTFDLKTAAEAFLSNWTVVPATMGLAMLILALAIIIGMFIALIRIYRVPILSKLATVYVSFMRGTPLIVLLFIVYFSLPDTVEFMGKLFGTAVDPNKVSPLYSVIITYSLYISAFQSENIKGALASVDKGQMEAAYSIGFKTSQALMRIVFPQALKVAVPNFCNAYIGAIKALSLAFTVGFVDILAKAKLNSALNFRYIESYLAAALVYWMLCIALTRIFRKIEAGLKKNETLSTR